VILCSLQCLPPAEALGGGRRRVSQGREGWRGRRREAKERGEASEEEASLPSSPPLHPHTPQTNCLSPLTRFFSPHRHTQCRPTCPSACRSVRACCRCRCPRGSGGRLRRHRVPAAWRERGHQSLSHPSQKKKKTRRRSLSGSLTLPPCLSLARSPSTRTPVVAARPAGELVCIQ
jgi:hypothetical protein